MWQYLPKFVVLTPPSLHVFCCVFLSKSPGFVLLTFPLQWSCLTTGATEGIWQAQGHSTFHQPVQHWVSAVRHRGVPRAAGQTEGHEQQLGQAGQLLGWMEDFTTGSTHAMSSKCVLLDLYLELAHIWTAVQSSYFCPKGLSWNEPWTAPLVGKHWSQKEWDCPYWPNPGQCYSSWTS